MENSLGVVHVRNDSADGRAVERAQAAMARWHERGWSVAPAPADGLNHPQDEPCLICGPGPAHLPALRAMDTLGNGWEWVTSDMLDEQLPGTNSTPAMQPLFRAGLVRRIHYGRRYAYQLTPAGLAALRGAKR